MIQFKDVFTGREKRDYARAATSQKCVRAGGKHNDLDNVGYTGAPPHVLRDARQLLLRRLLQGRGDPFRLGARDRPRRRYGLDPARLWATVYTDDDEAGALWERHLPDGADPALRREGELLGDGGDRPLRALLGDPLLPGRRPPARTSRTSSTGRGTRRVEIWNLVFMQFERDAAGKMTPLPKPVRRHRRRARTDHGVLQGENNNFDTDLFAAILAQIEAMSGRDRVPRAAWRPRTRPSASSPTTPAPRRC